MLGMDFLMEVKTMITDGDSQETTQLDLAIKNIFPMLCNYNVDGISLIGAGTPMVQKAMQPHKTRKKIGLLLFPGFKTGCIPG
jgi:hypothetical protein